MIVTDKLLGKKTKTKQFVMLYVAARLTKFYYSFVHFIIHSSFVIKNTSIWLYGHATTLKSVAEL